MFNVDGKEFITLVLIALVVLGPEKLPDLFRRAGRVYAEFKRMSDGFQTEFQRAIEEPMKQVEETRDLVRESVDFRVSDDGGADEAGADAASADGESDNRGGSDGVEVKPHPEVKPADADVAVEVEVDKDQADVERRIAEMEQLGQRAFGTNGQISSAGPPRHTPPVDDPGQASDGSGDTSDAESDDKSGDESGTGEPAAEVSDNEGAPRDAADPEESGEGTVVADELAKGLE